VEDRTLIDEVLRKLECDHLNVEAIFHDVAAKYAETLGQKILEDSGKLKQIRQQIVDWIMLEGIVTSTSDEQLSEALLSFLERLRALKGRTPEITAWHDAWFEAHALFGYQTFLYVVAALMQTRRYLVLADLLSIQYAIPASEGSGPFKGFDTFSAHSEALQQVLAPPGRRLYSPAAALIQRQADRHDISFTNLQEADALAFLVSVLSQNLRWYPQLLLYLSYGSILPFFHRAGYRKHFAPLDAVTGIANGNDLRRLSNAGVCDCRLVNGHSSLMAPDLSRRSTSQRLTHSKQRKWGLV